jgi:hypothetical protein
MTMPIQLTSKLPRGVALMCEDDAACRAMMALLEDAENYRRIRDSAASLSADKLAEYREWAARHETGYAGLAVRNLLEHIEHLSVIAKNNDAAARAYGMLEADRRAF